MLPPTLYSKTYAVAGMRGLSLVLSNPAIKLGPSSSTQRISVKRAPRRSDPMAHISFNRPRCQSCAAPYADVRSLFGLPPGEQNPCL